MARSAGAASKSRIRKSSAKKVNVRLQLALSMVIVWTVACGLGEHSSTAPLSLFITRVSGNRQEGARGTVLAKPLVVLVTDKQGQPAASQRVDFEVLSGEATLLLESAVSDAKGVAATRVRLGKGLGESVVRASIFGQGAAAEFTLTAIESVAAPGNDNGSTPGQSALLVTSTGGELVFELLNGDGLGEVEFGLGTPAPSTTADQRDVIFTVHLDFSGPSVEPSTIVNKGHYPAGSALDFYGASDFRGSRYWAFSSHLGGTPSPSDLVMFTDTDNSLRRGGSIVETLGTDHWILHLDDAASICCDDDDNELLVDVHIEPNN